MTKRTKNIFISLLISTVIIIGSATYIVYRTVYQPAFNIKRPIHLYISEKETVSDILQKIDNNAHPKCMKALEYVAKYYNYKDNIKTGHYIISPHFSAIQTIRTLSRGYQTPVKLVISSVRTKERMAKNISKQLMLDSLTLIQQMNDTSFIHSIGFNSKTFPAFFIPNTYEVYWNTSSKQLFKRLHKEYRSFWNGKRIQKAKEIGLSPTDVCTLASIVDEETANKAEKRLVAGLYINRLHKGMLLQADPTVKFAWQDPSLRRILNKHLTINSPYNTYKHIGLPPGPIRFPSMAAIKGVLNYAKHKFIYMCAKEDFSGTHNFARTLSEHMANARKYQRELNKRGIR